MLKQTPSQTVGPFFHGALISGEQCILTQERTSGTRIYIEGRLLDGDGAPLSDAMIEIWQADAHGIFNHPADPRHKSADPFFRGFGRSETGRDGKFWFKTIKPGQVPWDELQAQAPHISVRVFARG